MDFHIRGETAQLADELAERIGEPVEAAVDKALREALARQRDIEETLAAVRVIQDRVKAAYAASGEVAMTQAEWDEENYDEWGVPR